MRDLDEERLREGDNEGTFAVVHDAGREAGCNPAEDLCAPDEGGHDPYDSRHVPGTADDVPTSMGEDAPDPMDLRVESAVDAAQSPRFGRPLPQGATYEGQTGGEARAIAESRDERTYGTGAAVSDAALTGAPSSVDERAVARLGMSDAVVAGDSLPEDDVEDIDSLAGRDERELWRQQAALVEEDERNAYNLEGIPEDEIEDVLEAIGDDAAEASPELPEGTSATGAGSPLEPPHGGFPERSS